MNPKAETFLDRVTTGLASDPELQLDVRAELRAHIEDKTTELGGGDHADEAVASLGEVVELAEEVAQANQRRLGWRNLARRILRFGLVPASIACAIWFSGLRNVLETGRSVNLLGGDGGMSLQWGGRRFTPDQQLLLQGDPTRTGAARYRTLWERHPTNAVYYADYITHLLIEASDSTLPSLFIDELAEARSVDPQNGRYPLLAAVAKARLAADLETNTSPDHKTTTYSVKLGDRPALDQAMADLLAATAMPEYHSRYQDMLRERLAVLGPPTSLSDTIRRIALAAGTLLPDLSQIREAARYSMAYADLLIAEGRRNEAIPFLRVPEILARGTMQDSFTLIELLVSQALTNMAWSTAPQTLHQIGYEAQAEATKARLAAVRQPMQEWRDNHDRPNPELQNLLAERAGVLATMLLPALGGQETASLAPQLAADRRLELTVATQAVIGSVALLLVAAMLVCLGIALRWRLTLGVQAAPLLLLPSGRDLLRFVLLGVVLPFAIFLAWTHWLPFSGHAYSFKYAGHRITAEFVALLASLLLLPAELALRTFRRRCLELELPAPPRLSRLVYWPLGLAGLFLVVGFAMPLGAGFELGQMLVAASGAILVLLLLGLVGVAFLVPRRHGRTLGTLSRSLIPVFAIAILLLSLLVQPLLRHHECHQLQADTILGVGEDPGFTRMETELTNRLRDATLKAMAENPMPPAQP